MLSDFALNSQISEQISQICSYLSDLLFALRCTLISQICVHKTCFSMLRLKSLHLIKYPGKRVLHGSRVERQPWGFVEQTHEAISKPLATRARPSREEKRFFEVLDIFSKSRVLKISRREEKRFCS